GTYWPGLQPPHYPIHTFACRGAPANVRDRPAQPSTHQTGKTAFAEARCRISVSLNARLLWDPAGHRASGTNGPDTLDAEADDGLDHRGQTLRDCRYGDWATARVR